MELFRVCLFWCLISVHVVGGATWFHRRFPKESPWFGFLVPSLAVVVLLNAIEHAVALPTLIWLLPFTLAAALGALFAPGLAWRKLALPTGIFLAAFAFTLTLRALRPNVLRASSGTYDLSLVSSYCMGSTVPPPYIAFVPHTFGHYYALIHYAASILIRLFGLDIGTGINLAGALVSAWICVLMAAIAWRIGRQRTGLTILAAVLVECASNGSNVYLFFTTPGGDPTISSDLFMGKDDPDNYSAPLFDLLQPTYTYSRRELMVPGFWSWVGAFHATNAGVVLVLLTVVAMVETLRRRVANWPWICLGASPCLMLVSSTWGLPIVVPLTLATLIACAWYRLRPASWRFVLLALGALLILLAPTFADLLPLANMPHSGEPAPDQHTQMLEFLIYWWPIFLPWCALLFIWRRLAVATRIILVLLPLFYLAVEFYNMGQRVDTTGKLWGFIWALGWSVLIPSLARQRGGGFRLVTLVVLAASFLGLAGWARYYWTTSWRVTDSLRMEGDGSLVTRPSTLPILRAVQTLRGQMLLTGLCYGGPSDSAAIAFFTHNYSYVAGSTYIDAIFCPGTHGESFRREKEVSDFYHGQLADPLGFLRDHHIAAVLIFPDDDLTDAEIANLKSALAPAWRYEDSHDEDDPHAGIFLPVAP